MPETRFSRLNDGWNAEPNAPDPVVEVDGDKVTLFFIANHQRFPRFHECQILAIEFSRATRYRLGPTNDEGWYRGQCRFSGTAPEWGQFYEITGDLKLANCPNDWVDVGKAEQAPTDGRHFLFYLRDQTFECDATHWALNENAKPRGIGPRC